MMEIDRANVPRHIIEDPFRRAGFDLGSSPVGVLGSAAPPLQSSIGPPLLTTQGYGYDAALWLLSDGQAIVKIGCQTRLLTDWEQNAEKYVREWIPMPSDAAQPDQRALRILLSFLSLCRTAMESEQGAP